MPANLTPAYFEAEKQYRNATDIEDKIEALHKMLSVMPKHKGTDKLHAELRRKLAKLSEEAERQTATNRRGDIHRIRKEGAGQVVMVGLPNSGKSSLLSAVTEAYTDVADYPFTTQVLVPGMMAFENIQIQLIDTPAITSKDARSWLSNTYRNCDALLILLDLGDNPLEQMRTIIWQLEDRRVGLAGYSRQGADPGLVEKRALIVCNKCDVNESEKVYEYLARDYSGHIPMLSISAELGIGLEILGQAIFNVLDIIRVYTKAPGDKPALEEPVILKTGSTVEDAALSVHKDFLSKLKYALVWGSGKFEGQRVKRGHVLQDGDIMEFHI